MQSDRGDESYVEDVPTKTANARTVILDDETVQDIVQLRTTREVVSPYLFLHYRSRESRPHRWWWTRARELSGIDKKRRLRDLRHRT